MDIVIARLAVGEIEEQNPRAQRARAQNTDTRKKER